MTGCHPFLVQAVCSTLVDNLNINKRNQAELKDVEDSVDELFDTLEPYFVDLWERTDQNQRTCLSVLNNLEIGNIQQIIMYGNSNPDQEVDSNTREDIRNALQTLQKRDLIRIKGGNYSIATPIFNQWVKLYATGSANYC